MGKKGKVLNYKCDECEGELNHLYVSREGTSKTTNLLLCFDCGCIFGFDVTYYKIGIS